MLFRIAALLALAAPAHAVDYAVCVGGCVNQFGQCLSVWSGEPGGVSYCENGQDTCMYGCAVLQFFGAFGGAMGAAESIDLVGELASASGPYTAALEAAQADFDAGLEANLTALELARAAGDREAVRQVSALVRVGGALSERLDGITARRCFRLDAAGATPPPPVAPRFRLSQLAGPVRSTGALRGAIGRELQAARTAYDRGDRRFARGVERAIAQAHAAVARAGAVALLDTLEADARALRSGRSIRACNAE